LAVVLTEQGKLEESEKAYEQTLALNRNHEGALLNLASLKLHFAEQQAVTNPSPLRSAALQLVNDCIRANPSSEDAATMLAKIKSLL
jgi:hypothetical protein